MDDAWPRCSSCGYDLSGLTDGRTIVRCPECGTDVDPLYPYGLAPWPSPWRICLRLWGPCAVVLAAAWAADPRRLPPGSTARALEDIAGALAWVTPLIVVALPVLMSRGLAWSHAHPGERSIA